MANQDEELGYISTSPFLTPPQETKPQDEADLSTIKRIQKTLQEQIKHYESISSLTVSETNFTVKQQLAVNKMIVLHLNELKAMTDTTISNIKEKYNG